MEHNQAFSDVDLSALAAYIEENSEHDQAFSDVVFSALEAYNEELPKNAPETTMEDFSDVDLSALASALAAFIEAEEQPEPRRRDTQRVNRKMATAARKLVQNVLDELLAEPLQPKPHKPKPRSARYIEVYFPEIRRSVSITEAIQNLPAELRRAWEAQWPNG